MTYGYRTSFTAVAQADREETIVDGRFSSDGTQFLKDSENVNIGTDGDLKIYHSGSHSFIQDEGTGNLYIDSNQLYLRNADTDNVLLQTTSAGATKIKYNGSDTAVIETTSTGATVSNNLIVSETNTLNWNATSPGATTTLKIQNNTNNDNNATGIELRVQKGNGAAGMHYITNTATGTDYKSNLIFSRRTGSGNSDYAQTLTLGHDGNATFAGGINAKRLTLSDDGAAQPIFMLKTDDANPWGFIIKNDSYTTDEAIGLKAYQANNGDFHIEHRGDASYNNFYFKQHNGTTSRTALNIDTNGDVHVGHADNLFSNTGITNGADGRILCSKDGGYSLLVNRQTSDGSVVDIRRGWSSVGSISVTTSATAFNTSSDYRLKENEVAISDGITRLKTLQPYRFNFKAEPSKTVDGFFAHEAQAVVPEAITGTKDEVDSNGDAVMQGIDQSKLVPLLTAALQEAIAKIETLETKVAALESA